MSLAALSLALVLSAPGPSQAAGAQRVRWERGIDEAVKAARQAQKPIMVDFWAEWCSWCRRLDLTTYRDPLVVRLLGDFVALKVNTEGTPREQAFAARYDVTSLPTIAFFSPEGRPLLRPAHPAPAVPASGPCPRSRLRRRAAAPTPGA